MLNQVILVGRLSNELEIKELEENKKELSVVLAIPRSFKNSEGIYETDFINCKVYGNMIDSTYEYCRKGDLLGIKGRLQFIDDSLFVIADKISFLTSKGVK